MPLGKLGALRKNKFLKIYIFREFLVLKAKCLCNFWPFFFLVTLRTKKWTKNVKKMVLGKLIDHFKNYFLLRYNLTTPWPKARKNLNLRSKFKDFSCAFGQGVGILFFVGVFFPTIWHPRGGSFVCAVFEANLPLFAPLFRNTYRDRFYTLGRCSNLAAKQPWR